MKRPFFHFFVSRWINDHKIILINTNGLQIIPLATSAFDKSTFYATTEIHQDFNQCTDTIPDYTQSNRKIHPTQSDTKKAQSFNRALDKLGLFGLSFFYKSKRNYAWPSTAAKSAMRI